MLHYHDFCNDSDSRIYPACFIFASTPLARGLYHCVAFLVQERGGQVAQNAPSSSHFSFPPLYQAPASKARWFCGSAAQLPVGRASWALEGNRHCEEVPYLKDTRRKIIQLPPSVKASRQIPSLVHNLSPHPGSTDPSQPSKTPTRTASWQSVGLYPGREAGASVTEDCSGTLRHSGTVGLLQAKLGQLVRTEGLHFPWGRWLSYLGEELFFHMG